jgi:hypothetical protein
MELSVNKDPPNSCMKELVIAIIVILLCPLATYILSNIIPYINQYNYVYVGGNFAEALMQNNSRLARRLSASSQWGRIDAWMSTHNPFICPFSWDFDDSRTTSVGGLDEAGAHVSFWHLCWVEEYHEFEIDQITLQKDNNRWQVVDWSEILETR